MAFKPNYNHQRAERNRAQQAKKEAKLREKADARDRRKAEQQDEPAAADVSAVQDSPSEP